MNFLNLMNQKRFSPTAAQMRELESTTKAVIGEVRCNALRLSNVDSAKGTARLVHNGVGYMAVRLASNSRWYLTGDYTY